MYWLDMDPTKSGWELWGGVKAPGVMPAYHEVTNYLGEISMRTNLQVRVWLMITNTVDNIAYPPYRLQGLNNEKSDEYVGNNWSSETLKIIMKKCTGTEWVTMRQFIFDNNSFHPADGSDEAFSALIEVFDPNSTQSSVPAYLWRDLPDGAVFSWWTINGDISPIGVSTLKENDVLKR